MLLNLLGQNARVIGRARYFFWLRNYTVTLRVGLIALCLGLTVTSALLIERRGPLVGMMPVLGILGVAGFLFIYYNLELALLVTLVVSTLLHQGVGTGTGTPITFTFVLLTVVPLIWFFKAMFIDRSFNVRPRVVVIPALLFLATVVIATIWSGRFVDDEIRFLFLDKVNPRAMTALSVIVSVLTYFTFANHIRSIRSMQFFVWWFLAIGALFVLPQFVGMRLPEYMNSNGQLSTFVIVLALGQVFFNKELSQLIRLACIALAAIWLSVTFEGITWLSGWVPSVMGILVLAFLRSRKLLILLFIGAIVFVAVNADTWQTIIDAENAESGETRSEAWGRVFDVIDDHLLFGTGPAGYQFYFTVRIGGFFQLSHNNYVDILAQMGLVGFFFFIWMWLAMGWIVWRAFQTIPRHGFRYGLASALLATYLVTLVTMMLGDWITPFPYTQTLAGIDYTIWHWMMPGLAAALYYESSRTAEHNPLILAETVTQ
jgi:O-antigen ligase